MKTTKNKICIKKADVTYLDRIYEIECLSFTMPWSQEAIKEELSSLDFSRYFVLELENTTVAYSGYWRIIEEGHITNVAVHPDYRHNGYGELLMCGMIEDAIEHGVIAMTLEVRVSNENAIKLYEKVGFVIEGIRPKYYTDNGEDAYIMWNRNL